MSKRKDINKSGDRDHVVYSGWMTKSPPESKLTGPWKIFRAFSQDSSNRARWKKRFFVLSKPSSSLPGAYLLNYFSDENCKKVKGCIDLEQCLEIIESLDSEQFPYLLAVKTTHKSKERTYFLATETEEQMTTWVSNLCSVCGMKPDEPAEATRESDEPQMSSTTKPSPRSNHLNHSPQAPTTVSKTLPAPSGRAITSQPHRNKPSLQLTTQAQQDTQYFPLIECHSGNSFRGTARQDSVDSVPSDLAPPPPTKMGPQELDDVFVQSNVYDHPRKAEDDVYKIPPVRTVLMQDETYDIPPSHRTSTSPCSSGEEGHQGHCAELSFPHSSVHIPDSQLSRDDTYDVPPAHPPSRPPKPAVAHQEQYMNLPNNSKAFTDLNQGVDKNKVLAPSYLASSGLTDMYDLPTSTMGNGTKHKVPTETNGLLFATPPPPSVCGVQREHKYLNAASGYLGSEDSYFDMDPVAKSLDTLPAVPRTSSSTDHDGDEYTDMGGHSSFEDSCESNKAKPVYDQLPMRPGNRPNMPPRPSPKSSTASEGDTYAIFSTSRTRSFKKSSGSSSPMVIRRVDRIKQDADESIQEDEESNNSRTSIPLPVRIDPLGHNPDFSSSSEDEDEVLVDPNQAGIWGNIPPAPTKLEEPELKYLDLALNDNSDKEPMRSPLAPPGQSSPTEYREIDFVKTQALSDVKKMRKHDEK